MVQIVLSFLIHSLPICNESKTNWLLEIKNSEARTWERWCNLSSHGAVCAGEMAQRVERSCSRMKENARNLPESTFATAPGPQEKRKELGLAKADTI